MPGLVSPPDQPRRPARLNPETSALAAAVRDELGMDPVAAREYAEALQERETRRGGTEHAKRWQADFTRALRLKAAA